jgi:subtilase family serine protease
MLSRLSLAPSAPFSAAHHILKLATAFTIAALAVASFAPAQQTTGGSHSARPMILKPIEPGVTFTLKGNVRPDLTPDKDLGKVEDSAPVRLYLVLQRSPEQQADLDTFIVSQQTPGSPDFHKWLTPELFGERFGVAQADIAKITQWLQSRGFEVTSVAKNASIINFMATAAGVRNTFHAELHYWNVDGGKHSGTVNEPQIPAALANIVSGVSGLNKFPAHTHHTPLHSQAFDPETKTWHEVPTGEVNQAQPHYLQAGGSHVVEPKDYYAIYNVNSVFNGGNLGAGSTIAIVGEQDFAFGTVNPSTGQASGGDVNSFRTLFGVPGTLNMTVQHGDANFPCTDPGGDSGETALDSEWSTALAPNTHLIVETCSAATGGLLTDIQALVDANVADIISSSLGSAEALNSSSDIVAFETAFQQAGTQGQTILSAQGDSGSDDADFGVVTGNNPGVSGLGVDYPGSSPNVLSIGGTDFQDQFDVDEGSATTVASYWSGPNGTATGYIPETTWGSSCASSLIALDPNYGNGASLPAYCNSQAGQSLGGLAGGGGGGISKLFTLPTYQEGVPGLSVSVVNRVVPDVSMFAANGFWGHTTVACDSGSDGGPAMACTSQSTVGTAGGTSYAAPEFAGILGLLVTKTGSRQGLVQPALYELATQQFTNTGVLCYANGQGANAGVTTRLPSAFCVFHDVTTGNNDNACQAGSTNCFSSPGATVGLLSTTNAASLTVAYPAGPGYDEATGLGSVNVANLLKGWTPIFSSFTALSANPTSITSAQSTSITASVSGGTPPNSGNYAPPVNGSVAFTLGSTSLGSCNLSVSTGSCSISVAGSALQSGSNTITGTYTGTGAYPTSSNTVMVTNTSAAEVLAAIASPQPGTPLPGTTATFTWSPGTGVANYELYVGTSVGTYNIHGTGVLYNTTSATVSGLPSNGETIYVRLYSGNSSGWQFTDYTYTAAPPVLAAITSPQSGTQLTSTSPTFTWTPGSNPPQFLLDIGTAPGRDNLYSINTTATSATPTNLPSNGETLYVTLSTRINNAWQSTAYTYTAAPPVLAAIISPQPGTQLTSTSPTFTWSPGSNPPQFLLYIGTAPGRDNLYSINTTATSATPTNLPSNGETLYVTLYTRVNNAWQSTAYTYTAAPATAPPPS